MKKKRKRKLIGFIAREKGKIGKLQLLALSIAGFIIVSGIVPKITQAWNGAGVETWPAYPDTYPPAPPEAPPEAYPPEAYPPEAPSGDFIGGFFQAVGNAVTTVVNTVVDAVTTVVNTVTTALDTVPPVGDTVREILTFGAANTKTWDNVPESESWDVVGSLWLGGFPVNALSNVASFIQVLGDAVQEAITFGAAETLTFDRTGELNPISQGLIDLAWGGWENGSTILLKMFIPSTKLLLKLPS